MKTKLFLMAAMTILMAACGSKSQQADEPEKASSELQDENAQDQPAQDEPETTNMPTLTFADMAGIYDSYDEEGNSYSRFVLNEDGTAAWGMIGSLNFTPYTYTIDGNTIILRPDGVDTEDDVYDYDPVKGTLTNEQGECYQRMEE